MPAAPCLSLHHSRRGSCISSTKREPSSTRTGAAISARTYPIATRGSVAAPRRGGGGALRRREHLGWLPLAGRPARVRRASFRSRLETRGALSLGGASAAFLTGATIRGVYTVIDGYGRGASPANAIAYTGLDVFAFFLLIAARVHRRCAASRALRAPLADIGQSAGRRAMGVDRGIRPIVIWGDAVRRDGARLSALRRKQAWWFARADRAGCFLNERLSFGASRRCCVIRAGAICIGA